MVNKRTSGLPLICLVCGDLARGINFDLMTCTSCKTFFRRHALKSEIRQDCTHDNNCQITKTTRNACVACRLKKCLALGMNVKLIGSRTRHSLTSKYGRYVQTMNNNRQLVQIRPLSLLNNDHSSLTTNEWSLLSNLLHAYDAVNSIQEINSLIQQQASLPAKLRSKPSSVFNIIKLFYSKLQSVIECSPYARILSTDTYRALIKNNSQTFGSINSVFIMREINLFHNEAFSTGFRAIYGDEIVGFFNYFAAKLEKNGILIKILLFTLVFSTNCSIVIPDYSETIPSLSSVISLAHIQHQFITIFWKYLIYQYGLSSAVRWFDCFIKYVLDIVQTTSEQPNPQHSNMVETVVEGITHLSTNS